VNSPTIHSPGNELFRRDGKLGWLKEKEPKKMIGYSILIVEIKEPENRHF